MNSKILLLSIAVIATGLFAMPTTLSLFAGQHTFDSGDQVSCQKCHQDIYDEMANDLKPYGTSTAHTSATLKKCEGCHRTGNVTFVTAGNGTYRNYYNMQVNSTGAHAAVTLECVACHDAVPTNITNASEAHGPFYNESITNSTDSTVGKNNGTLLKGANEACVGCHTHTNIKITWRRSVGIDMIVNETTNGTYRIIMTANTSVNTTTTWSHNVTNSS